MHQLCGMAACIRLDRGAQVEKCSNKSVLTAIADSTLVCAGAILGGRAAMRAYLALMLDVAHFIAHESCMTEVGGLPLSQDVCSHCPSVPMSGPTCSPPHRQPLCSPGCASRRALTRASTTTSCTT